jgi:hypothetical protein
MSSANHETGRHHCCILVAAAALLATAVSRCGVSAKTLVQLPGDRHADSDRQAAWVSSRSSQRAGVQQRWVRGAVAGRARDGPGRRRLPAVLHPGGEGVEGGPEARQHWAQALGVQPNRAVEAIAAVELALPQTQRLLGPVPLIEYLTDPDTGEIVPITLVTDNGGPFRSFRFGALITSRPELRHVRTRVRSPGQNGVRERAFSSLKYQRLYREPMTTLWAWSARPRPSASSSTPSGPTKRWPGPSRRHPCRPADPAIPTFEVTGILPTS